MSNVSSTLSLSSPTILLTQSYTGKIVVTTCNLSLCCEDCATVLLLVLAAQPVIRTAAARNAEMAEKIRFMNTSQYYNRIAVIFASCIIYTLCKPHIVRSIFCRCRTLRRTTFAAAINWRVLRSYEMFFRILHRKDVADFCNKRR